MDLARRCAGAGPDEDAVGFGTSATVRAELEEALEASRVATTGHPGWTEVEAGVDESGQASVRGPIVAPPGRLGVQPSLAIQVSSQGGDGVLGLGGGLEGLSMIHRCARSVADGGLNQRVFDHETYCLDGARLRENNAECP